MSENDEQMQLRTAYQLLKEKRYDEARVILHSLSHPKAQEWLEQLGRIASIGTSQVGEQGAQLHAARDLISQRRFDEARVILYQSSHPNARQWLEELDKIAPLIAPLTHSEESPPEAKSTGDTRTKQMVVWDIADTEVAIERAKRAIEAVDSELAQTKSGCTVAGIFILIGIFFGAALGIYGAIFLIVGIISGIYVALIREPGLKTRKEQKLAELESLEDKLTALKVEITYTS